MYVLCLIDFEQITRLSWVCLLTFHIFRLFLIFLAFYIFATIFLGGLCVKKGRGVPFLDFLFVFMIFVVFMIDFYWVNGAYTISSPSISSSSICNARLE